MSIRIKGLPLGPEGLVASSHYELDEALAFIHHRRLFVPVELNAARVVRNELLSERALPRFRKLVVLLNIDFIVTGRVTRLRKTFPVLKITDGFFGAGVFHGH